MGLGMRSLVATLGFFMGLILISQAFPPKTLWTSTTLSERRSASAPSRRNETLAAYALSYANQRIADCNMEHSGGPYGENLAEGSWEMTGEEAVKLWAAEKPHYDYGSNSCVGDEYCGHYTQVVWRNSVHLGCARAKCRNGWVFVICKL